MAPFAPACALEQPWLFWLAPLLGAAVGALVYEVIARPRAVAA